MAGIDAVRAVIELEIRAMQQYLRTAEDQGEIWRARGQERKASLDALERVLAVLEEEASDDASR